MYRRFPLVALLVVVATLAFAGPGAGSSHYSITADPSVDTPTVERTITGETVEISEIGRVDPGESVTAHVTAPSDEDHVIYLYDGDQQIVDRRRGTGEESVTFDTGALGADGPLTPGTYALVVEHDGVFQDAVPLVVSGYHVTVDAPGSATEGDSITVTADVTEVDGSKAIDRVQVVIGDGSNSRRVTLDGPGGVGTYEETFTLDQLPAGDYQLYAGVQGEEEVQGRQELLGVSDSQSFDIEAATTTASSTTTTSTTTATTTASGGAVPGGGGAPPSGGSTDTDTTTAEGTTAGGETTDGSPSTTTDGVITPNPPTTDPPTTTTSGQALGVLPPALALLLVALLARRRR